jgi:transposase
MITAATLVAELGDITRFANPRQLMAFVGLVPSEDRGRVARPFGFALTDPGRRLSRTRLLLEVTRVDPSLVSRDE